MEPHLDERRMVSLAHVTCRSCGQGNSYEVIRLHSPASWFGFFDTTCDHCGARNVYHINVVDVEVTSIIDNFETIEES